MPGRAVQCLGCRRGSLSWRETCSVTLCASPLEVTMAQESSWRAAGRLQGVPLSDCSSGLRGLLGAVMGCHKGAQLLQLPLYSQALAQGSA